MGALSHLPAQKDDNSPYKAPDSHTADHSQKATVCLYPPFFVGNALSLRNYAVALSVARVQPDHKQLYLYQFPDQALFALDLLSPWEGARGRHRKTRKAHFAFVVFHGRGSEWYTKYHPLTHATATHNLTTKIIWGSISWCEWRAHRKQQRQPEWVRSPHFPLKFERSNFTPGNFSKLIL